MILGRTSQSAEARSNKNSLTKEKYYVISHLAIEFLIKNNITSLPINLNLIIKQNGWKVIPYTKFKKLNIENYNHLMKDNLGFVELNPDGQYFIFYDDTKSSECQRFTISHEIGHIMFNHLKVPAENREQEASMFAVRILMPACVLHECCIKSSTEIKELCFVSKTSANYRYARLELLKSRNKFYTNKTEKKLKDQFNSFINEYIKNNCS